MDALASLPLLSFLLIPSMGSYSTSLNLLFFYMTWSTLILSHEPLYVEVIGTLAIRFLFFVLPSTLFLAFDSAIPSLAANLKAQGDVALPTRKRGSRIYTVVGISALNLVLGVALQAAVETLFTQVIGIRSALKVTTTLPTPWGIAMSLLKGFVLREVGSMASFAHHLTHHALKSSSSVQQSRIMMTMGVDAYTLHSPSSPLSKYHQSWHHSIEVPYSFVANYDNPLTWFFWRWLPTYGPAIIFRFHLLTYFIFLTFVSLEETFSYSGYSVLPSSFVLGGIARRQDVHSMTGGKGNFSPLGLMDLIHGTSLGGDIGEDVGEDMEDNELGGLSGRAVERIGRKAKSRDGGKRKGKKTRDDD
ncbi:MAG: hypothetical protein M1836_003203 [Candelina mexicana]|nr:MAG: hypothetical protein M1836_003203 [Candelina mexicana]